MESELYRFSGLLWVIGELSYDFSTEQTTHMIKVYFRFNDRDLIPVFNAADSASFRQNILYLVYTNYDKPVDSFFLIGGLLATWTLMNALDKFEKVFYMSATNELTYSF